MSLFSPPGPSVSTTVTLKSTSSNSPSDSVLLSSKLWTQLCPTTPSDTTYVALEAPTIRSYGRVKFKSVVCQGREDSQTQGIAIPPGWLQLYPSLFPEKPKGIDTIVVSPCIPPILTEIVVSALGSAAYRFACTSDNFLARKLSQDGSILRQGALHSFASDSLPMNGNGSSFAPCNYQFRLSMTLPVIQGFAKYGETSFIVLLDDEIQSDELPDSNGTQSPTEDEACSEGAIEIDENFLANAIDGSFQRVSQVQDKKLPERTLDTAMTPLSLPFPAVPNDDHVLLVHTSDLAKLGALNGDWVAARCSDRGDHRIVQVFANDSLVPSRSSIAASPILLYNITRGHKSSPKIHLTNSPFGSGTAAIPTATSLTVARIASPLSTNRTYQPLFTVALKEYFESSDRIVKSGDVIALRLDASLSRHIPVDSNSSDDPDTINTLRKSWEDGFSEAVVYFLVTNLELPLKNDISRVYPIAQDLYGGATAGELGCWVDPSVTQLVQTGIQNELIPNVDSYVSPESVTSKLNEQKKIIRSDGPTGRLRSLLAVTLGDNASQMNLCVSIVLVGARGTGKCTATAWAAQQLGMHLLEINILDLLDDTAVKTEGTLRARFDRAKDCAPCILLLRHIDALSQTTQSKEPGKDVPLANPLRDCIEELYHTWRSSGWPVIVVGTTASYDKVPVEILSCFKNQINFESPNESERLDILASLTKNDVVSPDFSVKNLSVQTAAFVASDLNSLVNRARVKAIQRITNISDSSEWDLLKAGIAVTDLDFSDALGESRAAYSENIGAPKIPNVTWDDIGGLAHVKSDILDTIQLPLDHPELFADGLKKRSGILLYGPPGTGKTLLAKAVATSCSLNFFSVKGPELLNMYIGESEANVRRVFQRARDARPCVIFFDELDSIAPKRGNHGDSGGVMDRIVSQILAELDGMSSGGTADVFVIGATNRPDLLDPALLRPGRFDRMLYLGVSDTTQDRLNILEALTRKFKLDVRLDLTKLAEACPPNYTGADFYALCSDAMLNAMSRKAEEVENRLSILNASPLEGNHPVPITPQYYLSELATSEETEVLVSEADFMVALQNLRPSVSMSEMNHYKTVQKKFSAQSISEDIQAN